MHNILGTPRGPKKEKELTMEEVLADLTAVLLRDDLRQRGGKSC
jgi:hypothetical protein